MKKITVLVFMSLIAMVSLAQDIIITTEKEKIDAKVVEVSDAIIKYKKSSHIDGPTFVIEADKVVCITYENGDVDLMTTTNQNISNDNNIGYITKTDNVYTLYTKNGMTPMGRKAYQTFIENNSPAAWNEWKKGTAIMNTGWGLLAGGLATTYLVGIPVLYETYHEIFAVSCFVIGSCATIASIPLLAEGAKIRKNSYKSHNEQSVAQLFLSYSNNGLGLKITF